MDPPIQLCFGKYRSVTILNVVCDESGGEFGIEAAQLSEPLVMSADNTEVARALLSGAFRHGAQPGRCILLENALWDGRKVFGIDPAITIFLRG